MSFPLRGEALREVIGAVVIIIIGALFLNEALKVETNQDGLVGPSLVPSVVAGLVMVMGLAKGLGAYLSRKAEVVSTPSSQDRNAALLKLGSITALGFLYLNAFIWFGYFVSTALILVAVLYVFDNKEALRLTTLGLGGAIVYQLIFVNGMGIFDPPGTVINFQSFLPF